MPDSAEAELGLLSKRIVGTCLVVQSAPDPTPLFQAKRPCAEEAEDFGEFPGTEFAEFRGLCSGGVDTVP